jgi:hypothetical protein
MHALTSFLGNKFTALGTHLGRILGVDQDDGSASFFRFADRHADELVPSCVQHAFPVAARVAFAHFDWFKCLKRNHLIPVHQFAAARVREVAASIGDPFVDMGQCFLPSPVLIPVLTLRGGILRSLNALQIGFITSIETGVLNIVTRVRERGKRVQAPINPNGFTRWFKLLPFNRTREADRVLQAKWHAQFVSRLSGLDHLIVDKAIFLKLSLKDTPLAVGQIDSVFECLSYRRSIHDFIQVVN